MAAKEYQVASERPFPGTKQYQGWRYLYIEAKSIKDFNEFFDEIANYIEGTEQKFPEGGFGTTNSILVLPRGKSLYGLAVKGQLDVFEKYLRSFAAERRLEVAEVKGLKVILDEGDELEFELCGKAYYQ